MWEEAGLGSMKSSYIQLHYRQFAFAGLLSSCWLSLGAIATAQQTITIPNTATGNFRNTPGGNIQPAVTSNPVSLTAQGSNPGLEVTKSGDRGAAEPGDTVNYRVLVRNTGNVPITNLTVQDRLPLGLEFVTRSPAATLTTNGSVTPVTLTPPTVSNRTVTFSYPTLAPQQILTLTYAALLTPDAVRGTGRNAASAAGQTPGQAITSNIASHLLRIRPGILSDCGTIIGRVFVDKNFDGEQQRGEPGVPNAVVFMDDGNRITTDANGLFSLAYAIAGNRTGALDLTSLPGYTLAPNLYRIEANSQSRLVRLAPGGLARMNFAVTPTFGENQR